jgi:hypothetical protein
MALLARTEGTDISCSVPAKGTVVGWLRMRQTQDSCTFTVVVELINWCGITWAYFPTWKGRTEIITTRYMHSLGMFDLLSKGGTRQILLCL